MKAQRAAALLLMLGLALFKLQAQLQVPMRMFLMVGCYTSAAFRSLPCCRLAGGTVEVATLCLSSALLANMAAGLADSAAACEGCCKGAGARPAAVVAATRGVATCLAHKLLHVHTCMSQPWLHGLQEPHWPV